MPLFSQRYGSKPLKQIVQSDSMDSDLRNALWNALLVSGLEIIESGQYYLSSHAIEPVPLLCRSLWLDYFKEPLDKLPDYGPKALVVLRDSFFRSEWYEVYDFLEFVVNNFGSADCCVYFAK